MIKLDPFVVQQDEFLGNFGTLHDDPFAGFARLRGRLGRCRFVPFSVEPSDVSVRGDDPVTRHVRSERVVAQRTPN